MEICDAINDSKDPGEAERAAKCIHKRLQENDPKIIMLALTLTETCMKNCQAFPAHVNQAFMDEMVGISRASKGRENGVEAVRLIQQWAKGLPRSYPVFYETYNAMQVRGVSFPFDEQNENAALFDIPAPTAAVAQAADFQTKQNPNNAEISKLENDLSTVCEQVILCREMMLNNGNIKIEEDEALYEVIGFLEACRDRMADLIEAGSVRCIFK